MSGTPVKAVTGGSTAAAGTVLAQTGLGLPLFAAVVAVTLLVLSGALLVRSSRLHRPGRHG